MSSHRLLQDLFLDGTPYVIPDPGDTAEINPDRQFGVVELVSAGAETRTLADPKFAGQFLLLQFKTDNGDVTITADSAVDQDGNTSIVFDDAGDMVLLVGVQDTADNFEWRTVTADGVSAIGYLPLEGGTLEDGANIAVGATTGTEIGTAASQKLGFFGATPVVQPADGNQADQGAMTTVGSNTGTSAAGLSLIGDTAMGDESGAIMNDLVALQEDIVALDLVVTEIRTALVNLGLIKGSA